MVRLTTDYEGQEMSIVEALQRSHAAEGWTFLEVVGVETTDAIPACRYFSDADPAITASALIDGIETMKTFAQTDSRYLTVSMQRPTGAGCSDGDVFVLVFKKPQP